MSGKDYSCGAAPDFSRTTSHSRMRDLRPVSSASRTSAALLSLPVVSGTPNIVFGAVRETGFPFSPSRRKSGRDTRASRLLKNS